VHTTKTYRGSGGIDPVILNLGAICRCVVNLKTEKESRYPANWKLFVPQTQSRRFFLKKRKISFTCRNSNRMPSIPWLRHSTEHAIPALSVTVGVSSPSYLLPTTHTLLHNTHTIIPVLRGFLNAELSTGLHNGLPCRSPCAQCRPLYSEESHDNAGLLGLSTAGAPVSTAMQLQAVQPVFVDRCFVTVLEFHQLLVFRTEHNNPEAGSVFVVRRKGSQVPFRLHTELLSGTFRPKQAESLKPTANSHP